MDAISSSSSKDSPYICNKCQTYLKLTPSSSSSSTSSSSSSSDVCVVCRNLWQPNSPQLQSSLAKACEVYGGLSQNHYSSSMPVSIAGELLFAYRPFAIKSSAATPFSIYLQDLKQFLSHQIKELIPKDPTPPPILSIVQEEHGFLSLHLLCIPSKEDYTTYPSLLYSKRKRKRQRPFQTQGGDPKANLETRLQDEGYQWHSMSSAVENSTVTSSAAAASPNHPHPMEYHVAVVRKPIYLQGFYTKHRRDVSQSPFVVMRENNNTDEEETQDPSTKKNKTAEVLGTTSVEEQICNPIVQQLGVSSQNNISGNVIYGMCKFHASGREDMDVRMLLRPNTIGRPFCVQMIDAARPLESQQQLDDLVATINHTQDSFISVTTKDVHNGSTQWHGKNPMGVGIAPNKFHIAPASAYSSLQADTETKVKHYGCHCWSERALPDGNDITSKLFPNLQLPLVIQQKTPLRVVHRRANLLRERQILQLVAKRVDDHHFRLELSTQAGTYVKEFVHGDLLRTQPSIASLIGCKANLLLLDCEGIELGATFDT
jgi:tRNA U54 and U55 pseudouridine synthase Pus10